MRRSRFLPAALALITIAACDGPTRPPRPADATVGVNANVSAILATGTLRVTVTGVEIPAAGIVTDFPFTGGEVRGTLTLPSGPARRIVVELRDAAGIVVRSGEATIDIIPGQNPPLAMTLKPLSGSIEIVITAMPPVAYLRFWDGARLYGETDTIRMVVGEQRALHVYAFSADSQLVRILTCPTLTFSDTTVARQEPCAPPEPVRLT